MWVTHITTISANEINPNLKIAFCLALGIIGVVKGSLLHHPYELWHYYLPLEIHGSHSPLFCSSQLIHSCQIFAVQFLVLTSKLPPGCYSLGSIFTLTKWIFFFPKNLILFFNFEIIIFSMIYYDIFIWVMKLFRV
jgi:hypothetical protein